MSAVSKQAVTIETRMLQMGQREYNGLAIQEKTESSRILETGTIFLVAHWTLVNRKANLELMT